MRMTHANWCLAVFSDTGEISESDPPAEIGAQEKNAGVVTPLEMQGISTSSTGNMCAPEAGPEGSVNIGDAEWVSDLVAGWRCFFVECGVYYHHHYYYEQTKHVFLWRAVFSLWNVVPSPHLHALVGAHVIL